MRSGQGCAHNKSLDSICPPPPSWSLSFVRLPPPHSVAPPNWPAPLSFARLPLHCTKWFARPWCSSSTWEVASNSLLHPEHFTERLTNMVAYYLIEMGMSSNFKLTWMPHLKQFNYGGDLSRDVWKTRGQLVLSNSHAIFHDPVPCLENVIHVGGLHIKPSKPLPANLNTFMNNAKQGKRESTPLVLFI